MSDRINRRTNRIMGQPKNNNHPLRQLIHHQILNGKYGTLFMPALQQHKKAPHLTQQHSQQRMLKGSSWFMQVNLLKTSRASDTCVNIT